MNLQQNKTDLIGSMPLRFGLWHAKMLCIILIGDRAEIKIISVENGQEIWVTLVVSVLKKKCVA